MQLAPGMLPLWTESGKGQAPAYPVCCRLALSQIAQALLEVEAAFARINAKLSAQRDPMDDVMLGNMIEGYAYIDWLLTQQIELFSLQHVDHLLTLNHIVLCGSLGLHRAEYASHRQATEARFYEQREGGIQDLMEWYESHRGEDAWRRAAGVYVRILSQPQLFIEGNHRTGALVMSYLLMRDCRPPFVLTVDNAVAYFQPSTLIRDTHKRSLQMLYRLPKIKKRFAEFLAAHADPRFLCRQQGQI